MTKESGFIGVQKTGYIEKESWCRLQVGNAEFEVLKIIKGLSTNEVTPTPLLGPFNVPGSA